MPKATTKTSYTNDEDAFIIAYADVCIERNLDYKATVADELRKVSGRYPAWHNLKRKIGKTLKTHGKAAVKLEVFIDEGTGCLVINSLPPAVVTQINQVRSNWGLELLSNNNTGTSKRDTTAPNALPQHHEDDEDAPPTWSSKRSKPAAAETTPDRTISPEPAAAAKSHVTDALDHISDSSGAPSRTSPPLKGRPGHAAVNGEVIEVTEDDEPNQTSAPTKDTGKKRAQLPRRNASERQNDQKTARKSSKKTFAITTEDEETEDEPVQKRPKRHQATLASPKGHKKRLASDIDDESDSGNRGYESDASANTKRRRIRDVTRGELEDAMKALAKANNQSEAHLRLTHWLIRQHEALGEDLSSEANANLLVIIRTIQREGDELLDKLMLDLRSEQRLKEKYRDMAKRLVEVEDLRTGTVFPKSPEENDVQDLWAKFRDYILWTVGKRNKTPTPSLISTGYLSARVEDIASGRISDVQFNDCLHTLMELMVSPHAQQMLLGALFCRWVFQNPEGMLRDSHSQGQVKMYEAALAANSHAKVQKLDKLAARGLFTDADFQDRRVKPRVKKLQVAFEAAEQLLCPPKNQDERRPPPPMGPETLYKKAIALKQDLLLCPNSYRIHYIRPGTPFDSSWMIPYDTENWEYRNGEAQEKDVALCVFPALLSGKPEEFGDHDPLEDAFTMNKEFFPTFAEESMDQQGKVLCKAHVMVV